MGVRRIQEFAAATEQAISNQAQTQQAKGSVNAYLADRGIGGNSAALLVAEAERTGAANDLNLKTNTENRFTQLQQEVGALKAEAQNRISGATPQMVAGPSLLATGLQVGSGLASAYSFNQAALGTKPGSTFWTKPIFK